MKTLPLTKKEVSAVVDMKSKRIETYYVQGSYGGQYRDVTVSLVKSEPNEYGNTYKAYVGLLPIGTIFKDMATFERRSKGKRYVNSRWRSLRWFAEAPLNWNERTYSLNYTTIKEAAKRLVGAYVRRLES